MNQSKEIRNLLHLGYCFKFFFLFFSHDGFVFLLIVVSQKLLKMIYSSHLTLSKYLIKNYSCGRFPGR